MEYLTIIGGVFIAWLILVMLFAPAIPYHIEEIDPRSDHFIQTLEATCNTSLDQRNRIEIFTDGPAFYPAMLDAIRPRARKRSTSSATSSGRARSPSSSSRRCASGRAQASR